MNFWAGVARWAGPTGMLYEQKVRLSDADGKPMTVRRITIKLKKPTRDGDREIHLLTNLPAKAANAQSVANLYLPLGSASSIWVFGGICG